MNSISKNVYIEKLDHIVSKFINTYDRVKPVDVKSSTYIHFSKEVNMKVLILKLVILLQHQHVKTILQKALFKSTVSWTCVISDLKGKKLVTF